MKVNKRVEDIFAHAAAMHQSGRLKNTIYCLESSIYVLNQDHTVLIRFSLRDEDRAFVHPVSFEASDYDSDELQERGGRIEFLTRDGGYLRTKSCRTPNFSPEQVAEIFAGYGRPQGERVPLPATVRSLLDDSLSHIEFSARGGRLTMLQRNIYTGSLVTIEQEQGVGAGLGLNVIRVEDFGPVGMRTDDFMALYSFADSVSFWFGGKNCVHFKSDDPRLRMTGVVSLCVYDELGGELKAQEDQ